MPENLNVVLLHYADVIHGVWKDLIFRQTHVENYIRVFSQRINESGQVAWNFGRDGNRTFPALIAIWDNSQ